MDCKYPLYCISNGTLGNACAGSLHERDSTDIDAAEHTQAGMMSAQFWHSPCTVFENSEAAGPRG